ncbi:hypothetical protein [Pandoraea apista]|uniref:hypothetical protein n=1 Tax=Pandoraea apista TaxID=93218 RepID=UPI000F61FF85|nr:hypothetical protein [Pandoraea apista]RRJ34374.1 hypothetical protein EIB05_03775 [Pandoraea apista]RRJ81481.1 hypothetical protein EIL82_03750 [Pandoraea apista]RSD08234.1 hypothetical protein EIZ52_24775 [Pandoraea apista]RSD16642.1 hypothetical protein EJB12_05255 [Pandoraea apista]RSK87527.1 hypothetical protein EJE96_02065 [Pandoraea apista]
MKQDPAPASTPNRFANLETLREVEALIAQRKALEEHAESLPALIEAAKKELAAIGEQILDAEMSLLEVPEKAIPKVTKQRDDLEKQQVECELRIRRLRTQLTAIEARAPDIDDKIAVQIGFVKLEATMASEELQVELAEEIRQGVAALRQTYAKVRALQRLVPMPRTSDFLLDAYVPDLEACMRVHTGQGTETYNTSPNLLIEKNDRTDDAEHQIAEALQPIVAALTVCRTHRPYVPMDKRPQPYVIKGSNEGPARGLGGPIGTPAPPPKVIESKPTFAGYKTGEPYQIKSDQSGLRTRQAIAEMNMSAAIATAAESAER